jgi:hypothetical protein
MPSHPFISATTLLLSLCLTLTLTAQGTLAAPGEKTRPPATHRTAAISLKGGKKNTLIALMKSGALYRLAPAGTAPAFFQHKGRALGDLAFAGKNGAILALLSR